MIKEMLSRLSTAFRKDEDSNNYRLFAVIADEFDEIEQVIEQIRDSRFVEVATGKSLDYIAKLFNITRIANESDDELRGRLQVELQKYLSSGTINDILNVIKYFTLLENKNIKIIEAPDATLGFGEGSFGNNVFSSPKATFRIELFNLAHQLNLKAFYNAIRNVKAAGVYFQQDETVLSFVGLSAKTSGESSQTWLISTLGFGYDEFGEGPYGGYILTIKADAEIGMNLTILAFPETKAGIKSGLGFGHGLFGELGYSDRYDLAVVEWMIETLATAIANCYSQTVNIDIHTYFAFGDGGFGYWQYGGGTVSSANELDYSVKKKIMYSTATGFGKMKFNLRQNSANTGWIKIEYMITAPDGSIKESGTICEVDGGTNDSFAPDIIWILTDDPELGVIYELRFFPWISLNYGDTIEFRLLMKNSDDEACYNNIFDVWGVC